MAKDNSGARQRKEEKKASKGAAKKQNVHKGKTAGGRLPTIIGVVLGIAVIVVMVARRPAQAVKPMPPTLQSVPADLAPPSGSQSASAGMSFVKFAWPQSVTVHGKHAWKGRQSPGSVHVKSRGIDRHLHMVHNLLLQTEIDALLSMAKSVVTDAPVEEHAGTFVSKGNIQMIGMAAPDGAAATLQRAIDERLAPYARQQFNCPSCMVCHAMVKRYQPEPEDEFRSQRQVDASSYATLTTSLNPDDHDGGLYVYTGEQGHARELVRFQSGDVLAHRYDLEKGVRVLNGTRYEATFWLKDGKGSCTTDTMPWYAKEAAAGAPDAQFNFGVQLIQEGKAVKGIEWIRKAAEAHQLDAMATLGAWLMEGAGTGIQANRTRGVELTQYAASFGHSVAEFNLGNIIFTGNGLPKNEKVAAEWTWRSAVQGHARAAMQLGLAHKFGMGTNSVDLDIAARWFQCGAAWGSLDAMTELWHMFKTGAGTLNKDGALGWLRKASDRGSVNAKRLLGIEYLQGQFLEQDMPSAAKLLEEAAGKGDVSSQLLMGEIFAVGLGVEPNRNKARKWFKEAVKSGKKAEVMQVLEGIEADHKIPWAGLLEESDDTGPDLDEDGDILDDDDIFGSDEEDDLFGDGDILGED